MVRALSVFIGLCIGNAALAQSVTYQVVAETGQAAPSAGAGVTFVEFGVPVTNERGQVAYFARVQGAGVSASNNTGLWRFSEAPGAHAILAREGQAAPGAAPALLGEFPVSESPILNDNGDALSSHGLTGTGVTSANNRGLWHWGPSPASLVARTGNAAPDSSGAVYTGLVSVGFSSNGALAMIARLSSGPGGPSGSELTNEAVFTRSPGGAIRRAFIEGPLSEFPFAAGAAVGQELRVNASGAATGVLVEVQCAGPEFCFPGTASLFRFVSGGRSRIPPGSGSPSLSFFGGWNDGGAATYVAGNSLMHWNGVTSSVLLAGASPLPRLGGPLFRESLLNGAGQVVFSAFGTGAQASSNSAVCFVQPGSSVDFVAIEGQRPAGVPSGVVFEDLFDNFPSPRIGGLSVGSDAVAAFTASLRGGGVNSSNARGLWIWTAAGGLTLLARQGNSIMLPGWPAPRTIASLGFGPFDGTGGEDGKPRGLGRDSSGRSQVAFLARFTNGTSAIIKAALSTPPGLSAILVSPGSSESRVSWSSGVRGRGRVEFGTSSSLGQVVEGSANTSHHALLLRNLTPGETYFYRVSVLPEDGGPPLESPVRSFATPTTVFAESPAGRMGGALRVRGAPIAIPRPPCSEPYSHFLDVTLRNTGGVRISNIRLVGAGWGNLITCLPGWAPGDDGLFRRFVGALDPGQSVTISGAAAWTLSPPVGGANPPLPLVLRVNFDLPRPTPADPPRTGFVELRSSSPIP